MTDERPKPDPHATTELRARGARASRTIDDSVAPEGAGGAPGAVGPASPSARRDAELPITPPGRYDLEAEHARGGLGVILRVRDVHLERSIAIKELGDTGSPRARHRFVREALITARLQHPGVVPVYDAGRWPDGSPYYAMKLVSGRTLREELAARDTLDERLALLPNVLVVAEAVGYAHAEGVIHRDLKPDNIMIGAFGETVVLDWGLAKDRRFVDDAFAEPGVYARAHAEATRIGAVLGTPAYMAPEQARGEDVDERADVWAIGAILYHVLAAAPPFEGASDVVIERVTSEQPQPLAERSPSAPRDLCAIVDKAMARDPAARYANAKLLAGDLSRFLTGQLVGARAYGRGALIVRWLRRHRAAVSVAALLLAVLGATVAFSIRRVLDERGVARGRADELLLTQAQSQLDRDPTASLAWLKAYPQDGTGWETVRAVIADARSRGIAHHVWRGYPAYVGALAVAPGGGVVATGSDGVFQLWNARTGRRIARLAVPAVARLAFSPDGGTVIVAGQDGSLAAIAVATLERREIGKASGLVSALVVPDGRAVVTGDVNGALQLWPLDGSPPRELARHDGGVYLAEVVERGAAIVSIGGGDVELRRVPLDGAPVAALIPGSGLQRLDGQIGAFAVGDDGKTLAIAIDDRVLRWEVGAPAPVEFGRHRSAVKVIAISAAGRVVSGAEDGSITSWTGEGSPRHLIGHNHAITALGFSREGTLASGDTSGDVRLWTPTGSEVLRGHDGRIESLAFGPDETLYTAGSDRSVRAWPARPASRAIRAGTGNAFQLAFVSPTTIAATNEDGSVQLVSLASSDSRVLARFKRQAYELVRLPEGRFATSSWDGSIAVFGPAGDEQRRFDHGAEINGLAASPDGTRLASAGVDGNVRLWNVQTGEMRVIERRTGAALDVVFSPDGRTLVTSGAGLSLGVFDLVGGGSPRMFRGHTDVATALTFSADGRTLYSAGGDGIVRAWDMATGASRALLGHEGRVRTVALSPDQRYLASGGSDGAIIAWDLTQHDCAIVLRGHSAEVRHVVFSANSRQLASAGWDGTARLWNIDDGRVTVWRADDDKVQRVAFSPDGALVASAGADGTVRLWSIDDQRLIPNDHDALEDFLRAATTATIDDVTGSIRRPAVTTPP